MKNLLPLVFVALVGCAPNNYLYNFDLTDPAAHNVGNPREPDWIENADVKTSVMVDPTNFHAILLDISNKTDAMLAVNWNAIVIIGPDKAENTIRPNSALPAIQPGDHVQAQLARFELPAVGAPAEAYDNSNFELVVQMVVRGVPHEFRYHLVAHLQKV